MPGSLKFIAKSHSNILCLIFDTVYWSAALLVLEVFKVLLSLTLSYRDSFILALADLNVVSVEAVILVEAAMNVLSAISGEIAGVCWGCGVGVAYGVC